MAEALIKKAEKEKNRWFVSEEQKARNAAEYFEQAGNIYKAKKTYKPAAECFVRAAALNMKVDRGYDAAGLYKAAGIMLKLGKDPTYMVHFNRAVELYAELGKGSQAAKLSKDLGEQAERERNWDDALVHYQLAADLQRGEGSDSSARQSLEKVALFTAQTAQSSENYTKAAALFEEIGTESLTTRLGKYSAKKHFFKAILCLMASGDAIASQAKHDQFSQTQHQFATSREGKFLQQVISALADFNGSAFSAAYRGTFPSGFTS